MEIGFRTMKPSPRLTQFGIYFHAIECFAGRIENFPKPDVDLSVCVFRTRRVYNGAKIELVLGWREISVAIIKLDACHK